MAYDENLADRLRELLAAEEGLDERPMFGGLAFLVHGNMAVGVSRQGGLLLRVPPEETGVLCARAHAEPFEMRGRPANGWLRVAPEGVSTRHKLEAWVAIGLAYARGLPPKRAAQRRRSGRSDAPRR